jgi:hypothetical protein
MAKLYLPATDVARRLNELRNEQTVKREAAAVTSRWDPKELRALAKLAHDLYGPRGMAEIDQDAAGLIKIGMRVGGEPRRPGRMARCRWMFRGATIGEITEQVRLWRARQ